MPNLGLDNFVLRIETYAQVFYYEIEFCFDATGRKYRGTGTAPSPTQCFDAAMKYMSECMREAV